jgi:hypothetical protein
MTAKGSLMAQPPRTKAPFVWVAVIAVAVVVTIGSMYFVLSPRTPQSAPRGSPGNSQATLTTLSSIVDDNFTSAVDKQGDGGSYVEVRDVVVFKVITEEADGDWHVYIRDPTYDQFIAEIIPRDQGAEGQPPLNVPLVVWGITYCDTPHQNDGWHGYTCWEIHPLTSWSPM